TLMIRADPRSSAIASAVYEMISAVTTKYKVRISRNRRSVRSSPRKAVRRTLGCRSDRGARLRSASLDTFGDLDGRAHAAQVMTLEVAEEHVPPAGERQDEPSGRVGLDLR